MTQYVTIPLHDAGLLGSSQRVIALLEQQHASPAVTTALMRHYEIHTTLADHEQAALAAQQMWQRATNVRWQWEVAAQRLYNRIQQALIAQYGADSIEVQAIAPDCCEGSAQNVLHTLQRTRAALTILCDRPVDDATMDALSEVCTRLDQAITVAQEHRREWREAVLSQRVVQGAYERILSETSDTLHPILEQHTRTELHLLHVMVSSS